MKFSKVFFGYNRAEVDETVERMETAISTLETNVEYLKTRCETLEKQNKKQNKEKPQEDVFVIDKSVVVPIKKTLQQDDEQERNV